MRILFRASIFAVIALGFLVATPMAVQAQNGIGTSITADAYYMNQIRSSVRTPSAPEVQRARGVEGRSLNNFSSAPVKPFSDYQAAPTVSPYVNLDRDDFDLGAPTYQTLVQPYLQQQDFNQRQQVELQRINQQFQNVRSDYQLQQQGQAPLRPTGHEVFFMNMGHYFPRR